MRSAGARSRVSPPGVARGPTDPGVLNTAGMDMTEARLSVRKLAEVDFDVACFGHGPSIKGAASVRFRKLVDRLAA